MARTRLTLTEARWSALGRLGLDRKRWNALDPLVRRAVVAGVWIAVGLVVIGVFGVFKWSIFAAAAIVFALGVAPYERVPLGRFIVPLAVLAIAAAYPFYHDVHFGAVGVNPKVTGIHLSIWLILVIAAILTAVVGVIIGLPALRLRGDYLAIVTLGFGEIMPQIARNGNDLFGSGFNLTGGTQG